MRINHCLENEICMLEKYYYVCFHGDIKAIQNHLQILTYNSGLSQIQSLSVDNWT